MIWQPVVLAAGLECKEMCDFVIAGIVVQLDKKAIGQSIDVYWLMKIVPALGNV